MNTGKEIGLEYGISTRDAFGQALAESGEERANLIVLDGDVSNSTRTQYFAEKFPDRFINAGIAESNLVGIASGLASSGKEVVIASFAAFLMCNAFDQLRMSIAFSDLPVKIVGSHHGINIGEDGPSQMGIEDIALACALPGLTVLCPADGISAKKATRAMLEHDGPVYMRVGRPEFPVVYREESEFSIGKANTIRQGSDVTIIACGLMVPWSIIAAEKLHSEGIEARILDMHTIKPLDQAAIENAAKETGAIVTAEEHLLSGGLSAAVAQAVCKTTPVPMSFVGLDDTYAASGKPEEILRKYHLMPDDIVSAAKQTVARKGS